MFEVLARRFSIGWCIGFTGLLIATWAYAADHRDAPMIRTDPAADINDVYAFMNPNNADELILIMTVFPFADESSRFSDALSYNLRIENNADPVQKFNISCTFTAAQFMTCVGPEGVSVSGGVGETVSSGSFRVFTGLRDDPFFLDLPRLQDTLAAGSPRFTDPGVNTFGPDDNTLAIVIGINRGGLTANFTAPILKIYGTTERLQ